MTANQPQTDPIAMLTGPGGAFEVVTEDVLGVELQVYKSRMTQLRQICDLAAARGDATFLVQGERRLTFAQTVSQIRVVAANLLATGLAPGDRMAVLSANSIEWVVTFWAAAAAGIVCVPLNAWWKTEELAFALEDSGTRMVVCDLRRYELIRDVPTQIPTLERIFVVGGDDQMGSQSSVESFEQLLVGEDPGVMPDVAIDEDDICGIFYTSGTTGKPKGATITNRQVIANLQNLMVLAIAGSMRGQASPELGGGGQPASLLIVPLFHTTGCHATMIPAFGSGSKLVLMPPGRFDPEFAMKMVQDEAVTSMGGVPTIVARIVNHPERENYDLSSVTRISYGGAPCAPELAMRIAEAFPRAKAGLTQAYGLTESASVATVNAGEDYLTHPTSAGRAVPTVEIKIADDAGREVAVGEQGEIWLRGPTTSGRGYWNRPDANAVSYTDGWFHTGDIGKLDDEGFLYIVDRAKDMIIRAGENVYCVEIENVLAEHPDIAEAAIVGVPHVELGEEVKAVVVLAAGAHLDRDAVREFCAARLANFKVPEYVEFVTEPLPRNPAGKILKQLLRGEASSFAVAGDSDSAL
jgi:long-chain acyl-CoA synthetase